MPMEKNYWLGRWQRGETGWHQAEPEPALIANFSDLKKPSRIFVPLCGKSRDVLWLASQGHEVVGVELSDLACRQFFEESGVPVRESREGAFGVFRGGSVSLFNGDFFDLHPEQLGAIDAIYDRAALIALPESLRNRYAAHMIELLRACSRNGKTAPLLQIVLQRTPHDSNGPPFSVPRNELQALYGERFQIEPLSCEEIEMREKNPGKTEECVYLIGSKQ